MCIFVLINAPAGLPLGLNYGAWDAFGNGMDPSVWKTFLEGTSALKCLYWEKEHSGGISLWREACNFFPQ